MEEGWWGSVKRVVGAGPKRARLGVGIGIQTQEGFAVILAHGQLLPASATERFSTWKDGMRSLPIWLKGRIPIGDSVQPLQQFLVEELPGGPAGDAQIDVTVEVDASGTVRVESVDLNSGRRQSAEVGAVEVVMTRW